MQCFSSLRATRQIELAMHCAMLTNTTQLFFFVILLFKGILMHFQLYHGGTITTLTKKFGIKYLGGAIMKMEQSLKIKLFGGFQLEFVSISGVITL